MELTKEKKIIEDFGDGSRNWWWGGHRFFFVILCFIQQGFCVSLTFIHLIFSPIFLFHYPSYYFSFPFACFSFYIHPIIHKQLSFSRSYIHRSQRCMYLQEIIDLINFPIIHLKKKQPQFISHHVGNQMNKQVLSIDLLLQRNTMLKIVRHLNSLQDKKLQTLVN